MKNKVISVVLTLMVTAMVFFILGGMEVQTSSEYKEPYVVTFIEPTQPRFTREDTVRAMAMAFAMQESKCTEMAVSPCGKYVGCLQISEIMTREANRVQNKEQFTYDDRYKKMDSFKIFYAVMEYHNPELNIDRAVDVWNVNCPDVYRNNVKANYNLLLEDITKANYFTI